METLQTKMVTGHAHPDYAKAFAEFGVPRALPCCQGWVLERDIPGTPYRDAMGCYPLFSCVDWLGLKEDIDALSMDLVSVSMVPDPFGAYRLSDLRDAFDFVRPFKEHIVIDLTGPWESRIIRHHRRKCRRAFESVEVMRCETPQDYLDAWVQLYEHLVVTHEIEGMRTFSRRSLSQQLDVPGASLFVAMHDGKVVGALMTYQRDDVAYAHLTAADKTGYALGASYAIHLAALRYYVGKVRWFNLTGVPGLSDAGGAGLRWFKQGWSKATRQVYFCGRILDHEAYAKLTGSEEMLLDGYFPAYRAGEFC